VSTIYLDLQASTPLDPRVLEAMLPWLLKPGNPHASENEDGRRAMRAIEHARHQVASTAGAQAQDVIFTSGATEAANLVLRSLIGPGSHLAISSIEHPCVADTAAALEQSGARVTTVPVGEDGLVDTDALERVLDDGPDLVSLMSVNNEVGTIQPIELAAGLCREAGIPLHTDAAQATGRISVTLGSGLSAITLSGHKVHGPQGIGALIADREVRRLLRPLMTGGGQQEGIRPGTMPVALCVGLGEACRLAMAEMDQDRRHVEQLRDRFLARLEQGIGTVQILGSMTDRVPHNLNISIPGVEAEELLARAPGVALSTGSACSSGAMAPSRVLSAMGLDAATIQGAVRIGFGRGTTMEEVEEAARILIQAVHSRSAHSRGAAR